MTTDEFKAFVRANPSRFRDGTPETEESLSSAEQSLGVRLPESMRWLLKECGFWHSKGIGQLKDAIEETLAARARYSLPQRFVVIDNVWRVRLVLIDTADETTPGEPAIYCVAAEDLSAEPRLAGSQRFSSFGEYQADQVERQRVEIPQDWQLSAKQWAAIGELKAYDATIRGVEDFRTHARSMRIAIPMDLKPEEYVAIGYLLAQICRDDFPARYSGFGFTSDAWGVEDPTVHFGDVFPGGYRVWIRLPTPRALPGADVRLIGVYAMHPSRKEMGDAARYYGYDCLITKTGLIRANEMRAADLADLVLVEIEVAGPLELSEVGCWTRRTQQAPYLGFILSHSGEDLLYQPAKHDALLSTQPWLKEQFDRVKRMTEIRRICFFLHFIRRGARIICGGRSLTVQEITDLPKRLKAFAHYVPVD